MNYEQTNFEIQNSRTMTVVQHNSLVMARYDMSSLEQKIFLIMLSTIRMTDTDIKTTEFKVIDLANILEITPQVLYRDLKSVCKSLMSKLIEVQNDKGDWDLINIIKKASYRKTKGSILLTINEESYPYLLNLRKLFTQFDLNNIIDMKSKYSIRMYQQAKSNLFKGGYTITLEEFKNTLRLTKKSYDRYGNIKLKVLNPAIEEINNKTDLNITLKELKDGRKVDRLKFIVRKQEIKSIIYNRNNKNGFNNFDGRNYTQEHYQELERKLLGWD